MRIRLILGKGRGINCSYDLPHIEGPIGDGRVDVDGNGIDVGGCWKLLLSQSRSGRGKMGGIRRIGLGDGRGLLLGWCWCVVSRGSGDGGGGVVECVGKKSVNGGSFSCSLASAIAATGGGDHGRWVGL